MEKLLALGGKEVLIKSMSQAIPTFSINYLEVYATTLTVY
jgi:hypothetical protein